MIIASRTLLLCLLTGSLLAACGSSKQKKIAWDEMMRRWFANASAQPTDPPFAHWTHKQHEQFLRRIGYADVALIGRVTNVGTFSMRDDPQQVAFSIHPIKVLHGDLEEDLDQDGDLILRLSDADLDFRRAVFVQRFLPGKRFLAFLKAKPLPPDERPKGWQASLWRPPPKPKRVFQWALYRPERKLVAHVRALYDLLNKKK